MYNKAQATSLFTAAQSGLQNSIQYLLQQNKDGITQTNLNTAIYNNTTGINSSFYQMINSQFSTLDKNHDGVVTQDEANQMISNLSSGLTREQIIQLRASGSIDDELASKILSNFAKIDQNGDGKVSEAEINYFCYGEDIDEKKDEQKELLIKNMTCFFGDSSSDTETTSSSTKTKKNY